MDAGNWIAIVVGGAAIMRWAFEVVVKFMGTSKGDGMNQLLTISQVKSDLAAHEARDDVMFQWIKESMDEVNRKVGSVDRKLDNLQSQIRFVATGTNSRVIELGGRKDTDG